MRSNSSTRSRDAAFRSPAAAERGAAIAEYLVAMIFLILIFLGVAVWLDLAVNTRVDKAIDATTGMVPCRPDGPLHRAGACY